MGFVKNFDPTVQLGSDSIHVTGNSDETPGTVLISRTVALLQGDSYVAGLTPPDLFKWEGDIPLGDQTFDVDADCTAIGTELYAVKPEVNPVALAMTETVTWVQTVTIEKA